MAPKKANAAAPAPAAPVQAKPVVAIGIVNEVNSFGEEGEEEEDDDDDMTASEEDVAAGMTNEELLAFDGGSSPKLAALTKSDRRKEINRIAAKRSRERKAGAIAALNVKLNTATEQVNKLTNEKAMLLAEIKELESFIAYHDRHPLCMVHSVTDGAQSSVKLY